jgi:hypothetical protein
MKFTGNEKLELVCSICNKRFDVNTRDLFTFRKAKCRNCRSEYKFDSIATMNLQKAFEKLMSKATIKQG